MHRWFNAEAWASLIILTSLMTACGHRTNFPREVGPGAIPGAQQRKGSPSPSPSIPPRGFAACRAALDQLPLIRQDDELVGTNVLSSLQFSDDGKVVVDQKDASIDAIETDCKGDTRAFRLAISPDRSEQISFTLLDGKVKDVTVQHYLDGAWIRNKLTFLLSRDESACYVQHMHSDVEDPKNATTSTVEFDLETCRLARDLENNPTERDAVLRNGGLGDMQACETDFAKAALAQFDRSGLTSADATFHNVATQAPCPFPRSSDSPSPAPSSSERCGS